MMKNNVYIKQIYEEGLGTTLYQKPKKFINEKMKNYLLQKIFLFLLELIYPILIILIAIGFFILDFPLL